MKSIFINGIQITSFSLCIPSDLYICNFWIQSSTNSSYISSLYVTGREEYRWLQGDAWGQSIDTDYMEFFCKSIYPVCMYLYMSILTYRYPFYILDNYAILMNLFCWLNWALSYSLVLSDTQSSPCVFPVPVLESAFSPMILVPL